MYSFSEEVDRLGINDDMFYKEIDLL